MHRTSGLDVDYEQQGFPGPLTRACFSERENLAAHNLHVTQKSLICGGLQTFSGFLSGAG